MNRKERILLAIIDGLATTTKLGPYGKGHTWGSEAFEHNDAPGHHVHFAPWLQPKAGMIVMCRTTMSQKHDWAIAEVAEVVASDRCILRDLSDGRLLDMSNEGFEPIIGLRASDLWSDEQVELHRKVQKAFKRLDNYTHRYGGLGFQGNRAIIRVREVWGGTLRLKNRSSVPYAVEIEWSPRTTIKSIEQALLAAGFGEREFESVLSISEIGHNIKQALVITGQNRACAISELSHHEVERGHRLCLYSDTYHPRLALDLQESFSVKVETRDLEYFQLEATGIVSTEATSYYKHGIEVCCKSVNVATYQELGYDIPIPPSE